MKPSKTASPNVAVEWGLSLSLLRRSWISGDACTQSTVLWTSNSIRESRTYPPGFRNRESSRINMQISAFLPKVATSRRGRGPQALVDWVGRKKKGVKRSQWQKGGPMWHHVTSSSGSRGPARGAGSAPAGPPSLLCCFARHLPSPSLWAATSLIGPHPPCCFLTGLQLESVLGRLPALSAWPTSFPPPLLTSPFSRDVCPDAPHSFSGSALAVSWTSPHFVIRRLLTTKQCSFRVESY